MIIIIIACLVWMTYSVYRIVEVYRTNTDETDIEPVIERFGRTSNNFEIN